MRAGRRDARRPFKRRSETAIPGFGSTYYFCRDRVLRRRVDDTLGDDDADPLLLLLPHDVSRSRLECRYHSENNPLRKQLVTRHGVE